jgi:hypothetical protein
MVPGLRGSDLAGADLRDACLFDRDLSGANLSYANLGGALLQANLRGANLRGANLQRADLFNADLSGSDLDMADLRGAGLEGANLTGALLRGARFAGARYDLATTWPGGFPPERHGACRVEPQPGHGRPKYVLPDGFIGWIRVDYHARGAPPLPRDPGGYRILRFDRSGRLRTCTDREFDANHPWLFVTTSGRRLDQRRMVHLGQCGDDGPTEYEEIFIGPEELFSTPAGERFNWGHPGDPLPKPGGVAP